MSAAAHRALRKAIQDAVFDRAYYFHGDEEYLKESALRDLIKSAVDPATRDFNLNIRRGPELDAETADAILSTPPLMAARRVVVIRDATGLKRGARVILDRYLGRPADDTVVVMTSPGGVKADRALAEVATTVEFRELTGDRVPKWIVHHTTTMLGAVISPGAVDLLQTAVGNDLPQLAAELEKLTSYANGKEIDEQAVAAIVGIRRGETLGDFLDRVAERDAVGALALIDHVLQQPKTSAVTIVMALATQTLGIAWAHAALARGMPARGLERGLLDLMREGSAYLARPWGEAATCWARNASRWSAADTDRALTSLLVADAALKDAHVSSDEQLLSTLVFELCAQPRSAAA
jgi:DNA polymerase-3 subunit delta